MDVLFKQYDTNLEEDEDIKLKLKSKVKEIKNNESIDFFLDIFLRAKVLPILLNKYPEIYSKIMDMIMKRIKKTKKNKKKVRTS